MEKEAAKKMELIENEISLAKKKAKTDAESYDLLKKAEANEKLLTESYLKSLSIEALANNTKIFFGSSIPEFIGNIPALFNN